MEVECDRLHVIRLGVAEIAVLVVVAALVAVTTIGLLWIDTTRCRREEGRFCCCWARNPVVVGVVIFREEDEDAAADVSQARILFMAVPSSCTVLVINICVWFDVVK
jgi:hypothetical protein